MIFDRQLILEIGQGQRHILEKHGDAFQAVVAADGCRAQLALRADMILFADYEADSRVRHQLDQLAHQSEFLFRCDENIGVGQIPGMDAASGEQQIDVDSLLLDIAGQNHQADDRAEIGQGAARYQMNGICFERFVIFCPGRK